MAGATAALLLLRLPSPDGGCGRCSIAQRRDSSLHVSCVAVVYQAFGYSLSTYFGFNSCFLLFFPSYCSSVTSPSRTASILALTGPWCCPQLLYKTSGPDCLSDRFGAEFLVSYCICIHAAAFTRAYQHQWLRLLSAPPPALPPSLYECMRPSTLSPFSIVLRLSAGSHEMYITYLDFEISLG